MRIGGLSLRTTSSPAEVRKEPASLLHYTAKAGVTPLPDLLELYRLRWDLTEVSLYVALFRAPHVDTADTRVAWDGLCHSLQTLSALPS
jgi:spectinomycin phosphotransferase